MTELEVITIIKKREVATRTAYYDTGNREYLWRNHEDQELLDIIRGKADENIDWNTCH